MTTQGLDKHPRDWKDERRSKWRSTDRPHRVCNFEVNYRVCWQMWSQVLFDAYGTHARASPAVRNSEGLVQVEVADITAHLARRREAQHGVHVGTIDVDLTSATVDHVSCLMDGLVEDTVGGWLRDHGAGHVAHAHLHLQILEVDFTLPVCHHFPDLEADHRCGGEVSAVGGGGDETHVAMSLSFGCQLFADGHQAGLFSVRACVGLETNGFHASYVQQPLFQLFSEGIETGSVLERSEGVQLAQFRPRHRYHLRRRV